LIEEIRTKTLNQIQDKAPEATDSPPCTSPIFPPTRYLKNREREGKKSFSPQHHLQSVKPLSPLSESSIIKIESRANPWSPCLLIMNGEAALLGTGIPAEQV
jgi:hypothetical protein